MSGRTHNAAGRQRGFTLVELMVGLVLGLLTVLVISQVLAMAEGKKRSVSMGSDAQVNGALTLFTLQRDIQQAGYGIAQLPSSLGCMVKGKRGASDAFQFTLAPVVISDGASDGPDQITIVQGNTAGFSAPLTLTGDHGPTDTAFAVKASFGVPAGSMMIAVPKLLAAGSSCTLFNVTHDPGSLLTAIGPTRLPNAGGDAGPWNHSDLYPSAGYVTGDLLLHVGSLARRTFAISSAHNLQLSELSLTSGSDVTQDLYPQIVNLQAFYGKDTDANGVVDRYDATTPTTNEDWQKVLAVRIAVVARSNQYEKEEVTASAPLWDVGSSATFADVTPATCGASKCISLKVSQLDQWKHYRYKVYDTIVPLRNVLWNS